MLQNELKFRTSMPQGFHYRVEFLLYVLYYVKALLGELQARLIFGAWKPYKVVSVYGWKKPAC